MRKVDLLVSENFPFSFFRASLMRARAWHLAVVFIIARGERRNLHTVADEHLGWCAAGAGANMVAAVFNIT